jgi:hypothetical protein
LQTWLRTYHRHQPFSEIREIVQKGFKALSIITFSITIVRIITTFKIAFIIFRVSTFYSYAEYLSAKVSLCQSFIDCHYSDCRDLYVIVLIVINMIVIVPKLVTIRKDCFQVKSNLLTVDNLVFRF